MSPSIPQTPEPLSPERLAEYRALAAQITADPFVLSDCEGWLKIWRESALTHVTRDEAGEIDGFSEPSTYKVPDLVVEIELDSWDEGEYATDDEIRKNIGSLFTARQALAALVAENERLTARVAELEPYEALAVQQCPKGLHADWLVDSEHAHACPWCRIAELEAERANRESRLRSEIADELHRADVPTFAEGERTDLVVKTTRAIDVRIVGQGHTAPYYVPKAGDR